MPGLRHVGPGLVEHLHLTQAEWDACHADHTSTLTALEETLMQTTHRPLRDIAADIRDAWPKMTEPLGEETGFGIVGEHPARPYVDAMASLGSINDRYGYDGGREIVLRFLDAARAWRGDTARAIKAELKGML
jgi:hypothetical protein